MFLIVAVAPAPLATAHDIPNQRVHRSAQATLVPGKLVIEYEVSLSELTLTQDLRTLVGSLPGGDRSGWFQRYGEVTGPLDAKGFLVACDGNPVPLRCGVSRSPWKSTLASRSILRRCCPIEAA